MKTGHVYIIRNSITNNCYVGSSIELEKRFKSHMTQMRSGKHYSKLMVADFINHGSESFSVETLATVKGYMKKTFRLKMRLVENKFIKKLKPAYNTVMAVTALHPSYVISKICLYGPMPRNNSYPDGLTCCVTCSAAIGLTVKEITVLCNHHLISCYRVGQSRPVFNVAELLKDVRKLINPMSLKFKKASLKTA